MQASVHVQPHCAIGAGDEKANGSCGADVLDVLGHDRVSPVCPCLPTLTHGQEPTIRDPCHRESHACRPGTATSLMRQQVQRARVLRISLFVVRLRERQDV